MRLNKLSVKDKDIFVKYLSLKRHELSVYAFENIFLWKKHFEIEWIKIDDCLCVFFRDKIASFLYFSPLGAKPSSKAVIESFKIMDGYNKNRPYSRIENVEEQEVDFYSSLGYACKIRSRDYLCKSSDLAQLTGDKFKHKRASYNYFIKNYKYQVLDFSLVHREACLKLYKSWAQERKTQNNDVLYQGMLEDNLACLENLFDNFKDLEYIGKVVEVDGRLSAFTLGYPINQDTFCILYEVVDLSVKGLAQFIFRQFSAGLKEYRYINIMDDSGLENLKRVKLSYKPARTIQNYVVTRQ